PSDSAPMADDNRASRNNRTSSDGYRTLASYQTKKPSTARPPSAGPSTPGCTHEPLSPPWMMPYTRSTRPAMEASTPTKSIRPGSGFFDSGTSSAIAATLAAQNGTVISENRPNEASPTMSIRLRPTRSPTTPKVNSRPANTSV